MEKKIESVESRIQELRPFTHQFYEAVGWPWATPSDVKHLREHALIVCENWRAHLCDAY
jgi:hypothetical protein